jgi:group I intron endonuclease
MKRCGIYLIRHIATGRAYVGSSVDFDARQRAHQRLLRRGQHHSRHLQQAWDKYGADAFEFVFAEECAPETRAVREQSWIAAQTDGFNVNPFANNVGLMPKTEAHRAAIGAARRGKKHTEETRRVLSEKAKARVWTEEARAKLSASRKGKKRGPYSATHAARVSAARKGKPISAAHLAALIEGRRLAAKAKRDGLVNLK